MGTDAASDRTRLQEAGTRAIHADEQQQHADAVRLYTTALEVIAEGLSLQVRTGGMRGWGVAAAEAAVCGGPTPERCARRLSAQVPTSGLSAKADNVANWRQQLGSWQRSMQDRVAQLQAAGSRGASPPDAASIMALGPGLVSQAGRQQQPQGVGAAAARSAARQHQQQHQHQHQQQQLRSRPAPAAAGSAGQPRMAAAATAAAAAGAGAGSAARAALSTEDQRLRQIIMADVLDRSPHVTFDDIAGLRLAKQALQEAVILPTCVCARGGVA
jgi:hypothetical protein